jgi:hypothetical protein
MDFPRVVKDEVAVMYTAEVGDLPEAAQAAFRRLESKLDSLRGRRMYGLYFPAAGEYRACTSLLEGDDPDTLGFERGVLPGGAYLKARLRGEPEEIYPRIPIVFAEMLDVAKPDPARPSIEFYRRSDEVELLLPTADDADHDLRRD